MNVLTVVSPFRNYRMKLLELMSLTSVSMTLALGIMDEPETNAAETNAVSSLSALIIAVNIVFAQCTLFEVVAEVQKTMRKKKRTKQLWKSARLKKDLLIAILKLGSAAGSSTSQKRVLGQQREQDESRNNDASAPGLRMVSDSPPDGGVGIEMVDMAVMLPPSNPPSDSDDEEKVPVGRQVRTLSDMTAVTASGFFGVSSDPPLAFPAPSIPEENVGEQELAQASVSSSASASNSSASESNRPDKGESFFQYVSEEGDMYYCHSETMDTYWALPEGGIVIDGAPEEPEFVSI